ncbi:UGSC family (seleno)protein [Halodurantibacterium flavum]|uniref:UGSC family (Seleno)protein n=1 Tax=Halodurantibacterium flavum TaxID=1382802 RepID=A0ABW4S226_9RHOB
MSIHEPQAIGSPTRAVALDPTGFPPVVTGKVPAPRLSTLDGKTIYLVDSRFDDSLELLKQIKLWFARNMPSVTVEIRQLAGTYAKDDPALWQEIRDKGHAAIIGVGHCSTCAPAVSTHAITLETQYGVPTVAVHTDKFHRVVRSVIKMAGLPQAPLVFVPQPVMGKTEAELCDYVEGIDPVRGAPVMQEIVEALTQGLAPMSDDKAPAAPRERLVWADSDEALHDLYQRNRWTDFLPIVLPTEARVEAMLKGTSRSRDEVIGRMQPTPNRGAWSYTVEKVAVNAVMAGAKPEYFPVILALAASEYSSRRSSSSSVATMVVVNGPIRHEIGMNFGIGAMGPYNHANATIGRAYSLLSQNLQGGSEPGLSYMGSLGNAFTYSGVTFAENEELSPWEPLHVQHGFRPEDSTVTIFQGLRAVTHSLGLRETHWREHVADMLRGTEAITAPCLLLDPICARQFVDRAGVDSKAALIDLIHELGQVKAREFWDLQLVQNYVYPRATFGEEPFASRLKAAPDEMIPKFVKERINVVVTGGETNGYWQIASASRHDTLSVDEWR